MRLKLPLVMNTVIAVCLLMQGTSCTWTTGAGEARRTYVFGFGVVSQPLQEGQDAPKVWVRDVQGFGLGVTQGAGPAHLFCGAFACHETALPTGWEGVVEYKKIPVPNSRSTPTSTPKTP